MDPKMMWVPNSAKGREVGKAIRDAGYNLPNREIIGRYVGNIPGVDQFDDVLLFDIVMAIDYNTAIRAQEEAFDPTDI